MAAFRSDRNAVIQQQRQAMVARYQNVINELDRYLNPPPPPDPVEVVVIEETRGPGKLDWPTLHRWFS